MNEHPQIQSGDSRIEPEFQECGKEDPVSQTSASEGPESVGAEQQVPSGSDATSTAPASSSSVSMPNDPGTARRSIRADCHRPGNGRRRLPFTFPRGRRSATDLRHERRRRGRRSRPGIPRPSLWRIRRGFGVRDLTNYLVVSILHFTAR
jgi:hypothetical protein